MGSIMSAIHDQEEEEYRQELWKKGEAKLKELHPLEYAQAVIKLRKLVQDMSKCYVGSQGASVLMQMNAELNKLKL